LGVDPSLLEYGLLLAFYSVYILSLNLANFNWSKSIITSKHPVPIGTIYPSMIFYVTPFKLSTSANIPAYISI